MDERMVEKTQAKILYFDGEGRPLRNVIGDIEAEDETMITVRSGNLILRLGKRFIVKIERWAAASRNWSDNSTNREAQRVEKAIRAGMADQEIARLYDLDIDFVASIRRDIGGGAGR